MAETERASILTIDGVEAPTPSDFKPGYSTYDSKSSGRSESYHMTRDIVRSDLRKAVFGFRLKSAEMTRLLGMIAPSMVTVGYYDILTGGYTTFKAYASPTREIGLLHWNPDDPAESWWSAEISFIEY